MNRRLERFAARNGLVLVLIALVAGCQTTSQGTPQGPSLSRLFRRDDNKQSNLALAIKKLEDERATAKADPAAAKAASDKAPKVAAQSPAKMLELARQADRDGKLIEAERMYLEVTRREPLNAAAWNDLGLCYARQSRWDEGTVAMQQAVDLAPERKLYRNNLGIVLAKSGRVKEAVAEFTATVGEAGAHYNVGYLLMEENQELESAHQFLLAALKDTERTDAEYWLTELASRGALKTQANSSVAKSTSETSNADVASRPKEGQATTR